MPKLIDDPEIKDLLAQCLVDIKVTCGTMFPEIFYVDFSILHQQIFDIINGVFNALAGGKRKIAIAAPRGIGKTSIARAVVMRSVLFRLCNFIVYISNSATSAEMQTENIKRDLTTNKFVREIFGNIKHSLDTPYELDESFSKKAWTAFGNIFVLPRGAGQQVRGLNWGNHRPELVIIDDLENKDEIQSEDNRKKLKEWFYSDLMKTEDRYSKGCIFIYIDTLKHEDSLLAELMDSDEWESIQLSICNDKYETYDPNYMTTEEVKAEVEEHRRLGNLDVFYMERMNQPISVEDAIFKQEYFKYFDDAGDKLITKKTSKEDSVEVNSRNIVHVTIVDPAKTVKLHSAESSIQTVAVDRASRKIFNRYITAARLYPDELYEEMFNQVKQFNSFILGFETTGLNEFISQPIQSECRVRNLHPILMELQARKGVGEKGKIERIKTLAPLYKLGYIYHNPVNCGPLELQLLAFPRSKRWDVMDGFAYITHIMDKFAIYFDPTDGPVGEDGKYDEYAELMDDTEPALSEESMGFI